MIVRRRLLCLCGAAALLAFSAFGDRASVGQGNSPRYMGVSQCDFCHGRGADQLGIMNAYQRWSVEDEHSKAYRRLFNEQSRSIASLLGLPAQSEAPEDWGKCVRCHMIDAPRDRWAKGFDPTKEGISCEACHGPAEDYLDTHKSQTHEQNVQQGMIDLKDLRVRARTCLKCHSGLDHEIVAAGHPDLNFELFLDSLCQPPHWDYREQSPIKFWAIGQLVALESALLSLAEDSDRYMPIQEFAQDGCYHCHHKLVQDRWRQVKGHYSVARPLLKNLLGDEGEIDNLISTVREDLDDTLRPDRQELKDLSQETAGRISGLVNEASMALSSRSDLGREFIQSLFQDILKPIERRFRSRPPHIPTTWVIQNYNEVEQIYYALVMLDLILSGKFKPGATTVEYEQELEAWRGSESFSQSLNEIRAVTEHRDMESIEERRARFNIEQINAALVEIRNALAR